MAFGWRFVQEDIKINRMLRKNILDLLALTKSAITIHEMFILDEYIDWNAIAEMSSVQGISANLIDGIEKMPIAMRPSKTVLLQLIGRSAMQECMYAQHKACITTLAKFYAQHNIKMLLLKGYGCSLCYPKPEHRPTGDIDIFLFGRQEEADALVEHELGIRVHREYHKHSTFNYNGVEVENHAKFIDDVSHKSNIRFEQTLMSMLSKEECIESPINNVLLPPPTFNALFLLRHTGEHFASNEITLRHVLDVGTFFRKNHSIIDWENMMAVYQRERMSDFFNGIATICVKYLGMEAACFRSADNRYSYRHDVILAERILTDIFEVKDILPMSMVGVNTIGKKLKYSVTKTQRWWRNRWKYRLVYNESLAESFWWLARNRIKM